MFTKYQEQKPTTTFNKNFTSFAQPNGNFYNPNFNPDTSLNQKTQHKKGRPGGGWDSDDNTDQKVRSAENLTNISSNQKTGESKGFSFIQSHKKEAINPEVNEMEIMEIDESFLNRYEYEHKLINDSIQPGGARLKQSDLVLSGFCRSAENLNPAIVGSLLIYKLRSNIPWISKARTLYDIEALVKKYSKFLQYFKTNIEVLKEHEFMNEGSNSNQLRSIIDSIVNFLNDPQGEKNKPQIIEQYKPQKDLIDFGFEQSKQADQTIQNTNQGGNIKKLDAFKIFKKENNMTNSNNGTINNTDLLGIDEIKPTNQNQDNLMNEKTTNTNKVNAFAFINKTGNNTSSDINRNNNQTNQIPQNNSNNKPNAFGFIKSKSPTLPNQPQSSNLIETNQSRSGTNDTSASLLNLNFSYNQEPRAGNILNMYAPPPGAYSYAYGPSGDLLNKNFSGSNVYPPQPSYPYGFHTTNPYSQGYPSDQAYGSLPNMQGNTNPNPNPNIIPKDYDQLVKEIQNGVNYIAMSEEQKKLNQAEKQKKEEQDKYFDFIKF